MHRILIGALTERAVEEEVQTDEHTCWNGFSEGIARELILEHREPAE